MFIKKNPSKAELRNSQVPGSGTAKFAPANPVTMLLLAGVQPGVGQANAWKAASYPLSLAAKTFEAEDHMPLVFVSVKVIVSLSG